MRIKYIDIIMAILSILAAIALVALIYSSFVYDICNTAGVL